MFGLFDKSGPAAKETMDKLLDTLWETEEIFKETYRIYDMGLGYKGRVDSAYKFHSMAFNNAQHMDLTENQAKKLQHKAFRHYKMRLYILNSLKEKHNV